MTEGLRSGLLGWTSGFSWSKWDGGGCCRGVYLHWLRGRTASSHIGVLLKREHPSGDVRWI